MNSEKYTIKGDNGESLTIMRCGGMKYVTSTDISYYIDSEMVSSNECDFFVYSSYFKLYRDYEKEKAPENIEYFEQFDNKTGIGKGYIKYRKRFDSYISRKEKEYIIKRIKELCARAGIKIKVI